VSRRAQAVVMLLLGGTVVKTSITDVYLRYVRQGLRPLLVACGLLLIVGAVMTLWYDLRSPMQTDTGVGHAHRGPAVSWLLPLPVVGLLLVTPSALGSYTAGQAGSALTRQTSSSDYAALPLADPVTLTLLDYAARAVFDRGRSLADRRIQLTGFILDGPDGQPMLARIVLSCCAADGRPIKVGLSGDVPRGVPRNAWVTAVGTFDAKTAKDPINNAVVPYFSVARWQLVTAPASQYE
jgi:uncharacterized repeat protein (TIGR03943 family)